MCESIAGDSVGDEKDFMEEELDEGALSPTLFAHFLNPHNHA